MKFQEATQVPAVEWLVQGSVYDTATEAKFAAAKLFCNVSGVLVKRHKNGYALFWWRYNSALA